MLVGPADAKVVDGVQSERIEPGRDVALGSHGGRAEESEDDESIGYNRNRKAADSVDSNGSLAPARWRCAKSLEVLAPRRWMTKRFWFGLEVELNCHLRAFVLHGLGVFESLIVWLLAIARRYPDMNSTPFRRSHFLRVRPSIHTAAPASPRFSTGCQRRQNTTSTAKQTGENGEDGETVTNQDEKEEGAMARRLSQMTEDAMLEGGRSAQRNMEAAGFSEDLKKQLEERVKAASFRSEYAAAHSILDMPVRIASISNYHAAADPSAG